MRVMEVNIFNMMTHINRVISGFLVIIITMCSLTSFPLNTIAQEDILETSPTEINVTNLNDEEIQISLKSHITHNTEFNTTVQACDIILLFDQSNASSYNRDTILDSAVNLISNLPTPTDSNDQHRVAIAGFGRINNYGEYNSSIDSMYNVSSYNTGFYTYNTGNEKNINGVEFNCFEGYNWDDSEIPCKYNGSIDKSYSQCFMPISDALQVLNPDRMATWNSRASRSDAGLIVAENLAELQQQNTNERPLIVVFIASAVPIQNIGNEYYTRASAIASISSNLKQMATVYGLGDYHSMNQGIDESIDNIDKFNPMMRDATSPILIEKLDSNGNIIYEQATTIEDGNVVNAHKFYSKAEYQTLENAINNMLKTINDDILNISNVSINITADSNSSVNISDTTDTLENILNQYELECNENNICNADVNYYKFDSYSNEQIPIFNSIPTFSLNNQEVYYNRNSNTLSYTGSIKPTVSYENYANQKCIYGQEIEVILKAKLRKNSILIKKTIENLSAEDDSKFCFHVVGNNDNSKVYETWVYVSPNGDGILLDNGGKGLPNGTYTITELSSNGFKCNGYKVYSNKKIDSTISDTSPTANVTLNRTFQTVEFNNSISNKNNGKSSSHMLINVLNIDR